MTCDDWRDLILLEADGALLRADRERLAAHVAACPACRGYAGDARRVLEAFPPGAGPPVPAALDGRLMKLALGLTIRRPVRRWVRLVPAAAAAGVAATALALFLALPRPLAPLTEAELLHCGERQIAADLADLRRAIERQTRPMPVARTGWAAGAAKSGDSIPGEPSLLLPLPMGEGGGEGVDTRPMPSPDFVPRFDDELQRIGSQIEALDRPIFEDLVWTEGGSG